MYKNLKSNDKFTEGNSNISRFFAFSRNVILACEHSELSRESRNIKAIPLNRMYHPGSSANELTLKAKDDNRSVLQLGRSMIEMLGVLAIIAVLSVGGIAGYSKAMEKFKLTKAIGEYNLLVQGLVEHLSDFKKLNSRGDVYGIADTIQALGLVPDNWTIDQNTAAYHNTSFLDAYGNHSSLFSRWNRVVFSIGIGGANYDADGAATTPAFSAKFCEEIMANVFAPLHSFITFTGVWRSGKGNNDSANYWYGDKYCKSSNKQCLTSITPQQINEVCKKCTGATESCSVTVEME